MTDMTVGALGTMITTVTMTGGEAARTSTMKGGAAEITEMAGTGMRSIMRGGVVVVVGRPIGQNFWI